MRRHAKSLSSLGFGVLVLAVGILGVPRPIAWVLVGVGAVMLLIAALFWIGEPGGLPRQPPPDAGRDPRQGAADHKKALRRFQTEGLRLRDFWCVTPLSRKAAAINDPTYGGIGTWITEVREYVDEHLPEYAFRTNPFYEGRRGVLVMDYQGVCEQLSRDLAELSETIRAL